MILNNLPHHSNLTVFGQKESQNDINFPAETLFVIMSVHNNNNNNNNLLHLYSAFLDTQSALHSKGTISSSTTTMGVCVPFVCVCVCVFLCVWVCEFSFIGNSTLR